MALVFRKPIRIVERDVLDTYHDDWMEAEADSENESPYDSYCMDDKDPLAFWLFPLAQVDKNVIVTFAAVPPTLETVEQDIALSDMYVANLVDYVVYRALSKDARGAAPGVAEKYREKFLMALGAARQVMKEIGQNVARPPDSTE